MLHDRIQILVNYVSLAISGAFTSPSLMTSSSGFLGTASVDHTAFRSLSALLTSLPASDAPEFREEFDTVRPSHIFFDATSLTIYYQEYSDVQIVAYLASLTKSTNILNDVSLPREIIPVLTTLSSV